MHFQNIHTFTYPETLLHTLSLLVFKIVESLQCILNSTSWSLFSLKKDKRNNKKPFHMLDYVYLQPFDFLP